MYSVDIMRGKTVKRFTYLTLDLEFQVLALKNEFEDGGLVVQKQEKTGAQWSYLTYFPPFLHREMFQKPFY